MNNLFILFIIISVVQIVYSVNSISINQQIYINNNNNNNNNKHIDIGEEIKYIIESELFDFILIKELEKKVFACPCQDESLCQVLQTPPREEIVGFILDNDMDFYQQYVNWQNLTSVIVPLSNSTNPEIICLAHQHKVRVHHMVDWPGSWDLVTQNEWLRQNLYLVKQFNADGLNLDFEMPLHSNETELLNIFVQRISKLLHKMNPYIQLSYDVDLEPPGNLDVQTVGLELDFWFIMAYDCSWNSNPLGPNSPLPAVVDGLQYYLQFLHVNPWQLVLGLPWYGYYGQCVQTESIFNSTCETPTYKYPMSYSYINIYQILQTDQNSGELWNNQSMTPYVNYQVGGSIYQVQYDNPISIFYKVQYAKSQHIRGVGVWRLDFLDQSPNNSTINSMYDSLSSFLHKD
ncbi:glycoside hydrolase family 18 protein [Tieghemostelium lacteum]|uniref:Glycoside hydrolase family 18 protein n=1 Tax=Tieghemostelium lacteum TaxID=361077 RepID=A0A151ZAT6_TIELA|nr:glycoside hydrolase family 18 protein [Tieghemostelium lacteum]|eukprot:KYQ91060.1 glycoside hydrolase family 18 protein [Tieghemostelium lacteum]